MTYQLNIGPNVSTQDHTDLKRCTPVKVRAWWEAVKQNISNYDSYNWYIVGGMANGSQDSMDADIVITPLSGEVYDSSELPLLQSILVSAQQLALDNKFFIDLKAVPYYLPSPMGFTRDWFKITCWDRITITIDGDVGEWKNNMNPQTGSVEQLGENDLWKTTWTNDTGEIQLPWGLTNAQMAYTVVSTPVEDWCNA
mgnify:CR=1 FL=1